MVLGLATDYTKPIKACPEFGEGCFCLAISPVLNPAPSPADGGARGGAECFDPAGSFNPAASGAGRAAVEVSWMLGTRLSILDKAKSPGVPRLFSF